MDSTMDRTMDSTMDRTMDSTMDRAMDSTMDRAMASGKMPYDAKAFQLRADRVAFMATITPEVFPAGTATGGIPSKAKPEIWQDRADFDKLMKDLGDKTAALAVAAKSGSLDTIKPAFEAAAGACKACHDKYKVE